MGILVGGGRATAGGGSAAGLSAGNVVNRVVDLAATPRAGLGGGGLGRQVFFRLFSAKEQFKRSMSLFLLTKIKAMPNYFNPKIATLDNKEASIEQGLRIPYLKLTTEGTVTTDFIDATSN